VSLGGVSGAARSALLLTAAVAAGAWTLAPASAAPAPRANGSEVAIVTRAVVARAAPRADARPRARLRLRSAYSRTRQRLMVVGRHEGAAGARWIKVQLPIRPNGAVGWVPANAVRVTRTSARIEVRLRSRRVELWRGGRRVARWAAGIGTAGTPTPRGSFAVQDPYRVPAAGPRSVYGEHIITLTAHSEVLDTFDGGDGLVAIHGAGDFPWRVGRLTSHGCIVMADADLARLARHAVGGVPVRITAT
jgi:lipoprotein-anchoring transpeptidase ErfK/SrfK